jgi:hypothetical protein
LADLTRTVPASATSVLTDTPAVTPLERFLTDRAALQDTADFSVSVIEDFPSSPTITLSPTGSTSLFEATTQGHKTIRLLGGLYPSGDRMATGTTSNNAKVYCIEGTAIFDGAHAVGPFFQRSSGTLLRNFHVRRYIPDGGGVRYDGVKAGAGIINCESNSGNLFQDMVVGLSKMNAYKFAGTNNEIRGGTAYDCHRFAWNGGGSNNTVDGLHALRISYDGKTAPEVGIPNELGNRAICKVANGGTGWVVKNVTFQSVNQGIWFDIANEPAIIQNISGDDCYQRVVFLEVSYGQNGAGPRWLIDGVHCTNSAMEKKSVTPADWPVPSIVSVVLTPDVDIRNVTSDGKEFCTVGFLTWNHSQLDNLDRTRMGISGESVEDCEIKGYGFAAGFEDDVNYGTYGNLRSDDPEFANNTYDQTKSYRWKGSTITYNQWANLGHT